MTTTRGRPKAAPRRVTVTIAQHHADALQALAAEAGAPLSTLCAHVLERYAIQDRELMTNDVLAQKLQRVTEQAAAEFAQRFGDVLLRDVHETTALRRQILAWFEAQYGPEEANRLKEAAWTAAVTSLRPYTQRVRGDDAPTSDTESR